MAAFPFPIPDPPEATKTKNRVTFAFPPAPLESTAKMRIPPVAAPSRAPEEKEPPFRVPAWIPVPVEGALYFLVGTLLGVIVMTALMGALAPRAAKTPAEPTTAIPRSLDPGVRAASIVGPQTAAQRAPIAVIASEPSPAAPAPTTGPSLPLRATARLPSAAPRPLLRGR
ncbi:MAG: hypothetical protein JST00_33780 [Deltaproteobacteria bacterium]|nr:hypothetical protein [Deltaproteobacteria bacterium]